MLNLFQHPSRGNPCLMRQERQPCVYILASQPRGTLYIGVTSDLIGRLWQHRNGVVPGFTRRYKVNRLVRYELFGDMEGAILREKQLKRWHRQWKINLIESENPDWHDLAVGMGLPPLDLR
jgi:putative endonuclease